jgi:LytS/YehU family sensor histidine kinase
LKLVNQQLHFVVENSKSSIEEDNGLDTDKNIGLKNVKRRLVLFFPDKHQLDIQEEPDRFLVSLNIDLSGINAQTAYG